MALTVTSAATKADATAKFVSMAANSELLVMYADVDASGNEVHGLAFAARPPFGAAVPTYGATIEHLLSSVVATSIKLSFKDSAGTEQLSITKAQLETVLGAHLALGTTSTTALAGNTTAADIGGEPAITLKNTAFNKSFGITAGAVADGLVAETNRAAIAALPTSYAPLNAEANVAPTKAVIDALGVDSSTVNGKTVETNVPLSAVFTDTIVDISGKEDTSTTHTRVPNADATKLAGLATIKGIGAGISIDGAGVITADSQAPTKATIDALNVDAASVSGFTVGKNVPANAVFTDNDTTYDKADIITLLGTALPTSFAPTNAEANVVADWNAGAGDAAEVLNKPATITQAQADAIAANTLKVTNSHQDISGKEDTLPRDGNGKIDSSELPPTTLGGATQAQIDAISLNTAKVTNSHQDISGKEDTLSRDADGKIDSSELPEINLAKRAGMTTRTEVSTHVVHTKMKMMLDSSNFMQMYITTNGNVYFRVFYAPAGPLTGTLNFDMEDGSYNGTSQVKLTNEAQAQNDDWGSYKFNVRHHNANGFGLTRLVIAPTDIHVSNTDDIPIYILEFFDINDKPGMGTRWLLRTTVHYFSDDANFNRL